MKNWEINKICQFYTQTLKGTERSKWVKYLCQMRNPNAKILWEIGCSCTTITSWKLKKQEIFVEFRGKSRQKVQKWKKIKLLKVWLKRLRLCNIKPQSMLKNPRKLLKYRCKISKFYKVLARKEIGYRKPNKICLIILSTFRVLGYKKGEN